MATLTLLTLPIGNPQDITLRGLEALKNHQFFLAEDTREFVKLMRHYGIETKSKDIDSFHDHTDAKIAPFVQKILDGRSITLVSDAGSPIVSDPAYPLVRACLDRGIEVVTLPGVTSVITALELSGLPPHPFHFYGFLGRDDEKRKTTFEQCSRLDGTFIFFESPHRVQKTLELLAELFPLTQVGLGRELTKSFESYYRFAAKDWQSQEIRFQGEFVICLNFTKAQAYEDERELMLKAQALEIIEKGAGHKRLSKLLADLTGLASKDIYKELLKNSQE